MHTMISIFEAVLVAELLMLLLLTVKKIFDSVSWAIYAYKAQNWRSEMVIQDCDYAQRLAVAQYQYAEQQFYEDR